METEQPVLTDRIDSIKERMTEWQKIRCHKEAYTLDELNIFKSVNVLIADYNAITEEKTRMEPIRISYTAKQLSEILDRIDTAYIGSTNNPNNQR